MATQAPETQSGVESDLESLWQVVLLDDDDHTYEYVVEMLMDIFGHPHSLAYRMACEVDIIKKVVVHVGPKTESERGCQRIRSYGADPRLSRSEGSMSALIEPVA
jgi:ATP-dependent Clp protease adaptor protein ClpS